MILGSPLLSQTGLCNHLLGRLQMDNAEIDDTSLYSKHVHNVELRT